MEHLHYEAEAEKVLKQPSDLNKAYVNRRNETALRDSIFAVNFL